MSQPDGGPAFPAPEYLINKELDQKSIVRLDMTRGMTLRQWYAGMALQGLLRDTPYESDEMPLVAKSAFAYADAMLTQEQAPRP